MKLSRMDRYKELREQMQKESVEELEGLVEELSSALDQVVEENRKLKNLIIDILEDVYED